MEKISFVILTWNSEKFIGACLDSIQTLKDIPYEVIVADNGSSDGTAEILRGSTCPGLRTIYLGENRGTTVSRNIAIRAADPESEFLCILDSDTVINQDAILELLRVLKSNSRNGICGPAMRNLQDEPQISAKKIPTALLKFCKAFPLKKIQELGAKMEHYDFSLGKDHYSVGYLISACWLLRREAVERVGLLDEKIFYSPEDVEYCVRMWQSGYRVLFCPNAHIIHATQRISKKKLISRHNWEHFKGLVYFFKKYHLFLSRGKIKVE